MELRKFAGDYPKFTNMPIQVTGGFSVVEAQAKLLPVGTIIPMGTLAEVNENKREVTLIKTGRVVAIDGSNNKIITLQCYDQGYPAFVINENVVKDLSTTFAEAAKITDIKHVEAGLQLTLSKAITGLTVGDAIIEVVADTTNVKMVATPNSIVIADSEVTAGGDVAIDVTRDTGGGEAYARRLPPVPASLMEGNILKGTKLSYTNSL